MIERTAFLFFFIVSCLSGAAAVRAQSLDPGTIVVKVTDASTGKPIDNADVFLLGGDSPQSSLTNAQGVLAFQNVVPAAYRIKVEAGGYASTRTAGVEVGDGQRVDVAVRLSPRLRTIAAIHAHSTVSVSVESVNENSAQRKVSQSLADALNKIAGVSVDQNLYGDNSAFNVSLRGASAAQTGFSINGMQMGGAAAQSVGAFQDLFTGSSVDFSPSAWSTAGSVNFYTIQPTTIWSYDFTGTLGNYGNTAGLWAVTGGAGKAAFAFEHTAGGADSPLNGMYYTDRSGRAYTHEGGYARIADLFKTRLTLSPVSSASYTLMAGNNRSSFICADATALLPCSAGRGNYSNGHNLVQTLTFSSLAGHLQYSIFGNAGAFHSEMDEPNRAIDGVVTPYYGSGSVPWSSAGIYVSATSRRHTITGGAYQESDSGTFSSTFNGAQRIETSRREVYGDVWLSDKVKANDRLAFTHRISEAHGTGAGAALEIGEAATWQPDRADVLEASLGLGSAEPANAFTGTIADAAGAQYDCYNGSVYAQGPADQAVKQSSAEYDLSWRHTIAGGFISAAIYRNVFNGQSFRAGVPIAAEPPSLFPNGPAAYLSQLESVWSQPTVCGSTPFDPSRVYVSQDISGLDRIAQGIDISAQIPLGRNVLALPRYAVTNSYISSLDPRLIAPGSYYAPGAQLPHRPMHTAGLILDGVLSHASTEWLVDAEYTGINNGNNLPAYTLYNAGLIFNVKYGSIRLLEANIFGSHTGLFATYQGVNPMPLQGGGTFAYSTTPLPPRSFSVQYLVRWHAHRSAPERAAAKAKKRR